MRKAYIITTHAPQQIVSRYQSICVSDAVIAVDGGLEMVQRLGLIPDVIIGDMDSVSDDLLSRFAGVEIIRHPTAKNETDTELAIAWCLEQNRFDEIIVCNDMLGRFDHALAIVQNLMQGIGKAATLSIETANQVIYCLPAEAKFEDRKGQLLSVIPLSDKVVFSRSGGLKYSLDSLVIMREQSRGISNEIVSDTAELIKLSGEALAVITVLGACKPRDLDS